MQNSHVCLFVCLLLFSFHNLHFKFLFSTLYKIEVSERSQIGARFYIGHYGGIVIDGIFAEDCAVGQDVSFIRTEAMAEVGADATPGVEHDRY